MCFAVFGRGWLYLGCKTSNRITFPTLCHSEHAEERVLLFSVVGGCFWVAKIIKQNPPLRRVILSTPQVCFAVFGCGWLYSVCKTSNRITFPTLCHSERSEESNCEFCFLNCELNCRFLRNRHTRWRPRLKIAPPHTTACVLPLSSQIFSKHPAKLKQTFVL